MPEACDREHAQAMKADEAAWADAANWEQTAQGSDAASSSTPATHSASSDHRGQGETYFNLQLGIKDIKVATRKGMVCYHCQLLLTKGELRFSYAFHEKRPERSIHVGCLAQIHHIQRQFIHHSIRAFASIRKACEDALHALKPWAKVASAIR